MAFATNQILQEYVNDIFEHGVDDWTDELNKAEGDVINQIKVRYWNKTHNRSAFDKTKLTSTQWSRATVYRALSTHIMPKLSTYRDGDVFMEQIKFYKEQYAEELDTQFAVGIEYDTDASGDVDPDSEVTEWDVQNRLYR
tara:strand:- start:59 stop:478 length:420 start_codon:yes stop_codon:yes gene_type:complete